MTRRVFRVVVLILKKCSKQTASRASGTLFLKKFKINAQVSFLFTQFFFENVKIKRNKMDFETTCDLINKVKQHNCLWAKSSKDYRNVLKKEKIWVEIAAELKKSGRYCFYKNEVNV